jgi:hypothetical protein
MGVEMVIIFLSAIFFLCGLVLLMNAGDNSGRRAGFFMLIIGLVGIFISIAAYPRDQHTYNAPYDYTNESSTDYHTR